MDLGLAEKLAVRAVATATGASPAEVTAACGRPVTSAWPPSSCWPRPPPAGRPAFEVPAVVDTAAPDRRGGGAGLAGPQAGPAGRPAGPGHPAGGPLPAAPGHQGRCGWASARRPSWTRWPRSMPAGGRPGRCWNAPTTSAATWARSPLPWPAGGWRAVEQIQVRPGNPVRAMLAQRLSDRRGDPGQAGRGVRGRVQVRRRPGPGAPHRRRDDRAVHPAAGARVAPSSPTSWPPSPPGCGPAEAILEGEVVALRRGRGGAASRSGGHVPAAQARHRPRPYSTCRWACSASSCCTPTART